VEDLGPFPPRSTARITQPDLDDYLADYERRRGPISEQEQERARRVFDEIMAEENQ